MAEDVQLVNALDNNNNNNNNLCCSDHFPGECRSAGSTSFVFLQLFQRRSDISNIYVFTGQMPYCHAVNTVRALKGIFECWQLHVFSPVFRSSSSDDLINWNSGLSIHLSVCPSIRTSLRSSIHPSRRSFSGFDLIWFVGRPLPRYVHEYDFNPIQGQGQGH